ncbi:MAG: hypothetical protein II951_09010 [Bacteroidales bacterium]|nr:hypothetical protein [Bacteroidales bacterium]
MSEGRRKGGEEIRSRRRLRDEGDEKSGRRWNEVEEGGRELTEVEEKGRRGTRWRRVEESGTGIDKRKGQK